MAARFKMAANGAFLSGTMDYNHIYSTIDYMPSDLLLVLPLHGIRPLCYAQSNVYDLLPQYNMAARSKLLPIGQFHSPQSMQPYRTCMNLTLVFLLQTAYYRSFFLNPELCFGLLPQSSFSR